MSVWIWLAFALPVLAAMLFFFFTSKDPHVRLITKGGATAVSLATAVFAQSQSGSPASSWIIVCAVALFMLADMVLERKFLSGMAVFALGHIALLIWLFIQKEFPLSFRPGLLTVVLLYALSVFLFRKPLSKGGPLPCAMLFYAAVLSLMTGLSLTLPIHSGLRCLPFSLGALLFMISDLMVARGVLIGRFRKFRYMTMILYESGVLLMALSGCAGV